MSYRSLKAFVVFFLSIFILFSCKETGKHRISIIETTDIHGVILPYDFIEKRDLDASLAGAATIIKALRQEKDALFLLDDGDNLQGQPEVYYYNFIDTVSPHFLSEVMNWLEYDASTVGNHDIEAGHSVYDRLVKEYNFPLLAANAVSIETGKPYFKPYTIIKKNNIRVAVFGLITPAVPTWLPQELYSGMKFMDMVETAKLWMPEILRENTDLVVGLFHSGWDGNNEDYRQMGQMSENGSAAVAYFVPGFDIIFTGHDHRQANEKFINIEGDTVLILNGGSRSANIARADITFYSEKTGGKREKIISGSIMDVSDFEPDQDFLERFKSQDNTINNYVNKVMGVSTTSVSSRNSYFGPSAFVDMVHSIQLEITGADVSFAAPLSFDVKIAEGPITVGDMFKLYRFENMLYTMSMKGYEIQKYLEFSYSEWFSTMKNPDDYLLRLRLGKDGKPLLTQGKVWLKNQPYNFDSAAGIDYIVDISKPEGKRVNIKSFSDGRPFEKNKTYNVAVNSYRGNGGGGHFKEGAGINTKELRSRLVSSTDRDLRYYIMKSIELKKTIDPAPLNNWKIVPEEWVKEAARREYVLLFGLKE
ncbi:MAG: 5'-nucleotidase C-terminal domain-containing protein [Bacteroidales bacterium]|jgi:2',3'-cyclic-nucleotide 2'-phosphodiesterase/3'-nucleotidase|nr:5'-nucleotidase C-terminal domain-containing protein [Bacteroidales bacterium]